VQRAGAGVSRLTAWQRDLEEAGAFDGDVQRTLRRTQISGREVPRDGHWPRAQTGLEANRRLRLLRRGRAGRPKLLIHQVLELDAALLEAGRVHVGQVVRHVVDVGLLRVHAAGGRIQCADHL
jgi:hypothetical protein